MTSKIRVRPENLSTTNIIQIQSIESDCWVYSPEKLGDTIHVVARNIVGDRREQVCYEIHLSA
jgi:hypothetical protein